MASKATALQDKGDFGTLGRFKETAVADMTPETRDAYDFTLKLRGLVPGPHRIWLARPKLSKTIVPTGDYFQHDSSLTRAEIEIVTLLTIAHWRAVYAIYEHEKIARARGHLPPDQIARLIAGSPVAFDEPRETVIYILASALIEGRTVSSGLFKQADALIGEAGLVDVAVLIGWFTIVSATLNAFDVPADATGLDQ